MTLFAIACRTLAAAAFVWYMFLGCKSTGQAAGTGAPRLLMSRAPRPGAARFQLAAGSPRIAALTCRFWLRIVAPDHRVGDG